MDRGNVAACVMAVVVGSVVGLTLCEACVAPTGNVLAVRESNERFADNF